MAYLVIGLYTYDIQARVLLFGESAGAISVATHLLTARSTGLYHAALMESGCTEHNPQVYGNHLVVVVVVATAAAAVITIAITVDLQDIALQQASLYARYAGCGEAHGRAPIFFHRHLGACRRRTPRGLRRCRQGYQNDDSSSTDLSAASRSGSALCPRHAPTWRRFRAPVATRRRCCHVSALRRSPT